MRQLEVDQFIREALECSIYVDPLDPGLDGSELTEVGSRSEYGQGELMDALGRWRGCDSDTVKRHYAPDVAMLDHFFGLDDPEYRSVDAFEFVHDAFVELARNAGCDHATIAREVLVARAVAFGVDRHDVEVAITVRLLATSLTNEAGMLKLPPGREGRPSPKTQLTQSQHITQRQARPRLVALRAAVADVVARRGDGRPSTADALAAMAERLERLGYGHLNAWWQQTRCELSTLSAQQQPVASTLLSAALVEAALIIIVRFARERSLSVFKHDRFRNDPRDWAMKNLISAASTGDEWAVLSPQLRSQAELLTVARQRIHAGRLLSDYPRGVPDLRPEEAEAAKATAKAVVRATLDWVDRVLAAEG